MNLLTKYNLKREALLHILFWLFYIWFPVIKAGQKNYFFLHLGLNNLETPFAMLLTYINFFYFFRIERKGKVIYMILFFLFLSLLSVLVSKEIIDFYIQQLGNYSYKKHFISTLGQFIFVNLIFYTLYSIKKSNALNESLKIAEIENLKAQIDPHFLLNALHNIYSYTLHNNEKASELILMLSDNFRYLLYEGVTKKVLLVNDWQHIKNYIGICELRWEGKIEFEIEENINDPTVLISPLLLMTFVENAIKYTSKIKGSQKISIQIKWADGCLFFDCKNPYDPAFNISDFSTSTGIGLKNTRQRLELLYPDKHTLTIDTNNSMFTVKLTVFL
ncbi:MAG TPA: hypothetical protein DCS93_26895 [Microscillaceae bacterium]|nr:hypothetical protein [Microscillaceae bacterium]